VKPGCLYTSYVWAPIRVSLYAPPIIGICYKRLPIYSYSMGITIGHNLNIQQILKPLKVKSRQERHYICWLEFRSNFDDIMDAFVAVSRNLYTTWNSLTINVRRFVTSARGGIKPGIPGFFLFTSHPLADVTPIGVHPLSFGSKWPTNFGTNPSIISKI
jgi:hypothetical protein